MFTALRQAWRRYLDSLPRDDEPTPLSDAAILRAMHPPHPADVQQAFAELAALVTAHLPPEVAAKAAANLGRRLKLGVTPQTALVAWVRAHHGPKQRNLGLLLVDWKAREEIAWQAERIAKAHGVVADWAHDWRTDIRWEGWEARGELPVSAPLRSLPEHLQHQGLDLLVVVDDDTVAALAVAHRGVGQLRRLCTALAIQRSPGSD
jgi:hypothetical protein